MKSGCITKFICTLPAKKQESIKTLLTKKLPAEEVLIAMNGRVCDIEETVPNICKLLSV